MNEVNDGFQNEEVFLSMIEERARLYEEGMKQVETQRQIEENFYATVQEALENLWSPYAVVENYTWVNYSDYYVDPTEDWEAYGEAWIRTPSIAGVRMEFILIFYGSLDENTKQWDLYGTLYHTVNSKPIDEGQETWYDKATKSWTTESAIH